MMCFGYSVFPVRAVSSIFVVLFEVLSGIVAGMASERMRKIFPDGSGKNALRGIIRWEREYFPGVWLRLPLRNLWYFRIRT